MAGSHARACRTSHPRCRACQALTSVCCSASWPPVGPAMRRQHESSAGRWRSTNISKARSCPSSARASRRSSGSSPASACAPVGSNTSSTAPSNRTRPPVRPRAGHLSDRRHNARAARSLQAGRTPRHRRDTPMSHNSFDQVHLPIRPSRRSPHPARRTLNRLLTVAVVAVAGAGLHVMPASAQSARGAEATLQVVGPSSSSGPLLSDLTISQFAALVKLTPEQVVASVQPSLALGSADVEVNALLANPSATVGELIDLLTRAGVAPTTANEALDRLLSPVTGTVEQLSATLNTLLADLGEDGRLSTLAGELKLPAAVLETLQLAPTSVPELSKSLGTTAEQLRTLTSATGKTDREFVKESLAATPLGPVPGSGSAGALGGAPRSGGGGLLTLSPAPPPPPP